MRPIPLITAAFALTTSSAFCGGTIEVDLREPSLDRWMYPFNQEPGDKPDISTFGAAGIPDFFDDRDAQFLAFFDTSDTVPPDQGLESYDVTSARVMVTVSNDEAFLYDPTEDSYRTFLDPDDPEHLPDDDEGRPVLIHGVGFRNGFNALTFEEDTQFAFGDPSLEGVRNAFSMGTESGETFDASNNIRDRRDPHPLSVGAIDALNPGDPVPAMTDMTFTFDVQDPDSLAYLQEALDQGVVAFSVSSLHFAEQGGEATFPRFFSKENGLSESLDIEARLFMTVTLAESGVPADLTDIVVDAGTLQSGELGDLIESDDSRFVVRSEPGFTAFEPNIVDVIVGAQTGVTNAATFNIDVETKISLAISGTLKVRLQDFQTESFEEVGTFDLSTTEQTFSLTGLDAPDHIDPDGRIELSVRSVVPATLTAVGFDSEIDLTEIRVVE